MKTKLLLTLALGCCLGALSPQRAHGALIAYYPLDEATGNTNAYDSSGNNFTAISGTNDATQASGQVGYSKLFTGKYTTQAYIYNTPNTNIKLITNAATFTMSAWIKASPLSGTREYVTLFDIPGGGYYFLSVSPSTYGVNANGFQLKYNGTYLYDQGNIADGNWHNVAVVAYGTSSRTMFVDGISKASDTTTVVSGFSPTRIGVGAFTRSGSTVDLWNANVDEVGLFSSALTPQQIAVINALGRYESLGLADPGVTNLLNLYAAGSGSGTAYVGVHNWAYVSNLGTNKIGVVGSSIANGIANGNGYVVLGTDGSGVQMQGVSGPPAIVSFGVLPIQIYSGGSAALTWNVASANNVSITPGIGAVSEIGTNTVSPAVTTTYTLIATNTFGAKTNFATLTVVTNPVITFTASQPQIYAGDLCTLSWSVINGTNAAINQGVGTVALTGSLAVSPTNTETWTLIATNSISQTTSTNTVTVTVLPVPAPSKAILHWALDEMSGTNVFNSLNTNLYTGVFQDTNEADPAWTSGYLNGGLAFTPPTYPNETTIVRTSVAGAITNYPFTMSMWMSANNQNIGQGNANIVAMLMNSVDPADEWSLSLYNSQGGAGVADPTINSRYDGGNYLDIFYEDVSGAGWIYVTCVYESPYCRRLYLNGQMYLSDLVAYVPFTAPDRFSIGGFDRVPPAYFYSGSLDDVTLLSGRWNSNEVAIIYGAITGLNLNTADAEALLEGFRAGTNAYAVAQGVVWEMAAGLGGAIGSTGGSLAGNNAYVVMDSAGDGMQVVVAPPIIAVPPQNQTNYLGSTATFAVTAYSSIPLTYQWYFGANSLGGQTNSILSLADVQGSQVGSYYCTVANASGSTNSAAATLTVMTSPDIVSFGESQPQIYWGDATPVTLSWGTFNAATVQITPGIGAVAGNGTAVVSPTNTTTYTLTAVNPYGTVTQTVTLVVSPLPAAPQVALHYGLDEGAGTSVFNSVSTNFTGSFEDTNEIMPTWTTGFIGDGLSFTPSIPNENSAVRALGTVVTNYPFILSAWINTTNANPRNALMEVYGNAVSYYGLYLINNEPTAVARTTIGNETYTVASATATNIGWVQVVGVFQDPATNFLYVNGGLAAETSGTNAIPFVAPVQTSLGALDRTPNVDLYTGSLDEVTVLSGLWTSNDVAIIYGAMTGLGMNTADAEAIRAAFRPGGTGYAGAQGKAWTRVTGLSGSLGATGGSTNANNAYVVMDYAGGGMEVTVGTPIITSSPQSQTNYAGATVSFAVKAISSIAQTYQWYFGTNSLGGQTNSTLTLANIQSTNAGSYYCKVANTSGNVNSTAAGLTVLSALLPNLITQAVILPDGNFGLVANGTIGQNYRILTSASLQGPWTTVTNITVGANGLIQFEDTTPPQAATRFYQTVTP